MYNSKKVLIIVMLIVGAPYLKAENRVDFGQGKEPTLDSAQYRLDAFIQLSKSELATAESLLGFYSIRIRNFYNSLDEEQQKLAYKQLEFPKYFENMQLVERKLMYGRPCFIYSANHGELLNLVEEGRFMRISVDMALENDVWIIRQKGYFPQVSEEPTCEADVL